MSALNQLKDYRVVRAALPLQEGKTETLDAVAKVTTAPEFEVTFLPDQLPTERLNQEEYCQIKFDVAGETRSIKGRITSIAGDNKLLLEMVDSFSYVQKREYFRIDAALSVSYWTIDAENPEAKAVQTPVNIGGGGVRLPVSEDFKTGDRVGLEIVIKEPQPAVVECSAEVVGSYELDGEKQLALKFEDIEEEDQDAIVAYCLAEQRKQLRLKVKVLGGSAES